MIQQFFKFGEFDSRDYSCVVSKNTLFSAPMRAFNAEPMYGRSGDVYLSQKRWNNHYESYDVIFYGEKDIGRVLNDVKQKIYGNEGYQALEDFEDAETYREAFIESEFIPDRVALNSGHAKVNLRFSCKPQKFLKIVQPLVYTAQELEEGVFVPNPTKREAVPNIEFAASEEAGGMGFGNFLLSFSNLEVDKTYTFNGETLLAKDDDGMVKNRSFTFSGEFTIPEDGAALSAWGMRSLTVEPRWWRL